MYYFISQDIIITTCIDGRLLSPFCLASVQVLAPHLVPADGDFVFWLIKIVPTCRHISGVEQYSNTLTGWNWSHIGGVVRKLAMFVDSCLEVCEEPALDNLNSLTVSSLSWKGRIIRPGCRRTCHPHHRRLPSWAAPPGTCPGLTHSGCFPLTKFSSSLPTLPGVTGATAQCEVWGLRLGLYQHCDPHTTSQASTGLASFFILYSISSVSWQLRRHPAPQHQASHHDSLEFLLRDERTSIILYSKYGINSADIMSYFLQSTVKSWEYQ